MKTVNHCIATCNLFLCKQLYFAAYLQISYICFRVCDYTSVDFLRSRSALQTLHKVSAKAREGNYYQGGGTHSWVEHYESRIASDRSCLNEWHAMDCLESRRPPSPNSVRARPIQREETEKV